MAVLYGSSANRPNFRIDRAFSAGGDNIDLELAGSESTAAAVAILSGVSEFPPGDIDVADLSFKASTGGTVPLGDPQRGSVTFCAHGSGGFQMAAYTSPAAVLQAISSGCASGPGLQVLGSPGDRFLVLRLKYDAGLSAKGSAALAPALNATFGGSVSRTGEWAVVHRFGSVPAHTAVEDTIRAWVLPRQIDGPDRLRPGTWIVAEVDGAFTMNLGVRAGYDFSWFRELPGGAVTGDLGLKVQAATATLGLSVNGTYNVTVARETDAPVLRLSLSRADKKGWDFGVSASAAVVNQTRPGDLVAAILGFHPAQLAEDLRTLGPAFEGFLKLWDKLGAQPSATLLSLAAEHSPGEIRRFRSILDEIASAVLNPAQVNAMLDRELSSAAFFGTPLGKWLETLVETQITPFVDTAQARRIGELAGAARDLLNGTIPPRLAATLNTLPPFDHLEDWLKAKLAAFLGKPPAGYTVDDHQKMQQFHATLLSKATDFLGAAIKAVQKQFETKFVATYQASRTDDALIDAEFDFGENSDLLPVLRAAIAGDFSKILLEPVAGVRLKRGVLTHGITRHLHAELTLPFYDVSSDAVMSSLARITSRDDNGSVVAYELTASDEVTSFVKARSARDSKLAMAATFADKLPGVRSFGCVGASFGYSLRAGFRGLTAAQLEKQMEPIQAAYFADRFGSAQSLHSWAGTGLIGDSLLALDVSVAADAVTEWFAAPADPLDPVYFSFSRRMQALLKSMVGDLYFNDPSRYASFLTAAPVLVWSSLPPATAPDGRDVVWDMFRDGAFESIARSAATRESLWARCLRIKALLDGIPKMCRSAAFYAMDPRMGATNLDNLVQAALRRPSAAFSRPPVLGALVAFEQKVIRSAVSAAVNAARFRVEAGTKPGDAVRYLSKFGADVVTAFHEELRSNLAVEPEVLVPLGSSLFVEAGRALRASRMGGGDQVRPRALFSLTVLKPGTKVTPRQLLGGDFQRGQIALEQRIAS